MVSKAALRYLAKIMKQKEWEKGDITEDFNHLPEEVGQGIIDLRYA